MKYCTILKQTCASIATALALASTPSFAAEFIAPKPATPATLAVQVPAARATPVLTAEEIADAHRGFIGTIKDAETLGTDGHVVYSLKGFEFENAKTAPATVNPGLLEQAGLDLGNGLYKVTDRAYQVRGFDIANMTIIEGDSGIIIIDPLMTAETSRAALDLYYKFRPRKPVVAVIYNHSHVDHFGGVKGIVTQADVDAGKVQIIAPTGLMEAPISENVLAGNAMNRRAAYQFGMLLPRSDRGHVDIRGAKAIVKGTVTLIAPTRLITQPVEKLTIDGVEIANMLAQGTEAPAELVHYFPQFKVLNNGELALQSMHQFLTLRGAEIRDGNAWAKALNNALAQFGDGSDILISQHTWPVFGHERVVTYLPKQRDMYQWLHDQSMRLMDEGMKPTEIAERMTASEPPSLAGEFYLRGFYGSIGRSARAVYQKYLGWYDANPVNLERLTPTEDGKKFVEYAGGAKALLKRAHVDYAKGDYWAAEATNALAFADPTNREARDLCADVLEQIGYQHQSGVERDAYLTGAQELRNGVAKVGTDTLTQGAGSLKALSVENIFDLLGVRLVAPKAEGKHIVLNWDFTDLDKRYVLNLENEALTWTVDRRSPTADLTLHLTSGTLKALVVKQTTPEAAIASGALKFDGDPSKLKELTGLMDTPRDNFEIVAPNNF